MGGSPKGGKMYPVFVLTAMTDALSLQERAAVAARLDWETLYGVFFFPEEKGDGGFYVLTGYHSDFGSETCPVGVKRREGESGLDAARREIRDLICNATRKAA